MSTKYTGGFITKNPVAPTTSAASGIWTLDQQQQAQKAGTWPSPPMFIEDLFSTYLYTGNSSTQTITNNIDLSTKGGLTWIKSRSDTTNNFLFDTIRGVLNEINSNNTQAQASLADSLTAFNTNGFSLGNSGQTNFTGETYVSWTFREQPKFFDVVTYTGNATAGRTVAHNLGSVPGCIIIKKTTGIENWAVYHRSLGTAQALRLNLTNAASSPYWNGTSPTSTVFTVDNSGEVNDSGATYVAYLFAHDAGGFPVSGGGSTNGISCGSFTSDGSGNASVNLGYEPQFWLYKPVGTGNWTIYDTMRGWSQTSIFNLNPNTADAEGGGSTTAFYPTATGFDCVGSNLNASATYIYIAIRRGPMKTPTTGTEVFAINTRNGSGTAPPMYNSGYPIDMAFQREVTTSNDSILSSRLISGTFLRTSTTAAEGSSASYDFDYQNGWFNGTETNANAYSWMFRRYPSVFDVVCYTGTGDATTQAHNLGVTPEFIIVKSRSNVTDWACYQKDLGNNYSLFLNLTDAQDGPSGVWWNNTTPTASVFSLGTNSRVNAATYTYVAYLFASCPGVSKVGSYTGTGALQTVNCGFTTGARFVLIKRTDSTGDWWLYDSARGITSGNDPYLFLNTNATQVTGTNYVDTTGVGFQVTAAAPAGLNASGGNYIFLAIA